MLRYKSRQKLKAMSKEAYEYKKPVYDLNGNEKEISVYPSSMWQTRIKKGKFVMEKEYNNSGELVEMKFWKPVGLLSIVKEMKKAIALKKETLKDEQSS